MRKWIAVASALLSVSTSGRAGDYLYVWGMETRDPAPPCDWIRIGAPQKVVLDAEHERAEIEFDP